MVTRPVSLATSPVVRTAVARFAPPLALMALIFVLSAQPDLNSGLGLLDTILRKLAHMAEFGLLWWLWWRALGIPNPGPAIAITLLYAASDEIHQHFVAGRHGSMLDWCIDAAGVGLAGLAVALRERRLREAQPLGTPR
jgi:VanZ family protein